jgi:hypothetical protein
MCCENKKYIARTTNTILLSAGGFSFGHDVGETFSTNSTFMGFAFALLFFLFSIWMRRMVRCNHKHLR